jgi:two-component system LytT family response regulator
MKLNCVVVDDSSIQRAIIAKLVNNHSGLHLIGDFSNAIEAKSCISLNTIDLIFLDIEMPVINGFDFLDGLKSKLQIIFITSKAEYALKAFDYDATDYLQKPLSVDRFNASVKRALDLHILKKDIKEEEEGDHIFIKSNLKKLKIFTSKIKWIEAFGDYVRVVTEDDSNLVLSTMKSFENDLSKEKFIRVHKSYIINIDKVERFNSKFAEIGITKIPLSRNKKEDLVKALSATS